MTITHKNDCVLKYFNEVSTDVIAVTENIYHNCCCRSKVSFNIEFIVEKNGTIFSISNTDLFKSSNSKIIIDAQDYKPLFNPFFISMLRSTQIFQFTSENYEYVDDLLFALGFLLIVILNFIIFYNLSIDEILNLLTINKIHYLKNRILERYMLYYSELILFSNLYEEWSNLFSIIYINEAYFSQMLLNMKN